MGNFKDTLLLPKTTLPISANLPVNEPTRYASWWEGKAYERLKRDGKDPFILHDGPPYANGDIHIGHALNKILKDFVVKLHYFNGRAIDFRPGWDCHGLPIEQKTKQQYPNEKDPFVLRQMCRHYAAAQVEKQKVQFKSLGVIADWDNPYLTMDKSFETLIFSRLCDLWTKGLLVQRSKPVFWSWAEKTALAEAEIEYKDRVDNSVYVVFPTEQETFPGGFLVWTTTPWTLPANVAVALNPQLEYIAVKVNGYDKPVMIQEDLFDVLKAKGIVEEKRGPGSFKGTEFDGWKLKHPIYDGVVPVVMADFVSKDSGTGCVHIAPGHGEEDYLLGCKFNLPTVMPVGPDGIYTEGKYVGHMVFDANKLIAADLKVSGRLVFEEQIKHSYPHCWRSGTPIIFRATNQFFLDLGKIRDKTLEEVDKVEFYPEASKNRMKPMLTNRFDWCLSRQRVWGVPIAFLRNKKGELSTHPAVLDYTKYLLDREGIDVWSIKGPDERKPEYFSDHFKDLAEEWEKVPDILDVWFDSGLTWNILNKQADVYLEGNDQHRGWFQSSLWLSVALTGQAPYKKVITHGFVVDGAGQKMSKQKGNVVNPNTVVAKYGSEVIRYWVSSIDYTKEVSVNDEILKRAAEGHKKLRNTFRFLLANLGDSLPVAEFFPADRWIMDEAIRVFNEVHEYFEKYEFHRGMHKLTEFVNGDLNSIYFNSVKDRLYCDKKDGNSRNACRYMLSFLLEGLLSLVAPLFTYTVDEVFSHTPEWFKKGRRDVFDIKYESLKALPKYEFVEYVDDYWKEALSLFFVALEKLKAEGKVKESLEVNIEVGKSKKHLFAKAEDWFGVSFVTTLPTDCEFLADFTVQGDVYRVVRSPNAKCERCWKRNGVLCQRCNEVLNLQPKEIVVG